MRLHQLDATIDEEAYLNKERSAEIKHEYINGYVYAMAGASKNHERISNNVLTELKVKLRQLDSTCDVFGSDVKVKTNHNFFYPDVMVVCDDNDNESEYYSIHPIIIVEVLSKSTRKNDQSTKRLAYFNIPTLQEYILIEQDKCEVQAFRRQESWQSTYYYLDDEISFKSISLTLNVNDIYYQVQNEDTFRRK